MDVERWNFNESNLMSEIALRAPYIILLNTHIELISEDRSGWVSSRLLFELSTKETAKIIDEEGQVYRAKDIELGRLKILGPMHVFSLLSLKSAPRGVNFKYQYKTTKSFEEIKTILVTHMKKYKLYARPDSGNGLGKYYTQDSIINAENYEQVFESAKFAMNRKYMRAFFRM